MSVREKYKSYIAGLKTVRRPKGNQSAVHHLYYKDCICALDIETTNVPGTEHSIAYIISFGCDALPVIHFRTWTEFVSFVDDLRNATKGAALPVYVHNLQFEFQFLSGVLPFKEKDVLCGKQRDVIKAYSEPLEFRCSFKLTGQGLADLTESLNVKHKKLSGKKYDYSKIRYPWTALTPEEMEYIDNDILGLIEAVTALRDEYGDTIYTIPITQTGYSRRECKKLMRSYSWQHMNRMKYDVQLYTMMRGAMRGGNCIANRFIEGEIIENEYTYDMSSAYLAAILYGRVPMGAWHWIQNPTPEDLIKYTQYRRHPVLVTVKFINLRLKDKTNPAPYIMKSKTAGGGDGTNRKERCNVYSGRVLSSPELRLTITDIDFNIIINQYDYDSFEVLELAINSYAPIPEQIRNYVRDLYKEKTILKGINLIRYNAKKREANAIFGMFAEDPGKTYYAFSEGGYKPIEKPLAEAIAAKQERAFCTYAWGVWVTAIVRSWLQKVIDKIAEKDNGYSFLYCDTDGVKCASGCDAIIEEYNKTIIEKAIENGAWAKDRKGVIHYCGAFELEKVADRFVTLGQKKYCEEVNGELQITIAGVKKKGETGGAAELGKIENFREGFTFHDAGGNEAIYNDLYGEIIELDIDGHKLEITRNVTLRKIEFTLGAAGEYKRLSIYPERWLKLCGVIK